RTMGVRILRSWKAEVGPTGPTEPAFTARYYARARAFWRNEWRKRGDYRLGQQDREIQRTKTEPEQHDHPWENSHKTMQIEREMHRRGRGRMAMSLVGSLHLV